MRVLIVRTDFLGDGVLSSPFIQMLHGCASSVDLLCYDYNYVAFKFNPCINKIYYLKKDEALSSEHNHQIIHNLGVEDYTAIFVLNRDRKNYQIIKRIKTDYIFGHELGYKSFKSRFFMYYAKISSKYNFIKYDDAIHEVVNSFNLLKLGLSKLGINTQLKLEPHCYFYTDKFSPLDSTIKDINKVVLNISGRAETVRYIPTSLAICIINGLLAKNYSILLVASFNDKSRALDILNAVSDTSSISLCCENDLFVVANTMSQCEYFIGADGGLLHIAAGLGMKCVGLFHAQNINSWHPWSSNQRCIQTVTKRIYDILPIDVINMIYGGGILLNQYPRCNLR